LICFWGVESPSSNLSWDEGLRKKGGCMALGWVRLGRLPSQPLVSALISLSFPGRGRSENPRGKRKFVSVAAKNIREDSVHAFLCRAPGSGRVVAGHSPESPRRVNNYVTHVARRSSREYFTKTATNTATNTSRILQNMAKKTPTNTATKTATNTSANIFIV